MTTASVQTIEQKSLATFSATCGDLNVLRKNGLNTELNWVFKHANDPLTQTASGFVCRGADLSVKLLPLAYLSTKGGASKGSAATE